MPPLSARHALMATNTPSKDRRRAPKRMLFAPTVVVLSAALACLAFEVSLRLLGFRPWAQNSLRVGEPRMHEPDSTLGWRPKEGHYIVPSFSPSGSQTEVTILANGTRATARVDGPAQLGRKEIILIGGSFTQGWAIADKDTFGWKLQEAFPSLRVLNYGTGGYGTCQSLLLLRKALRSATSPIAVLYGFIQHHEVRNVAPYHWLEYLSRRARRLSVGMPYATIGDSGQLREHVPQGYPAWPLRDCSAAVVAAQRAFMRIRTMRRASQGRAVTEQLLIEMDRACQRHRSAFFVVLFEADEEVRSHYMAFVEQHGIKLIDCAHPLTHEMRVEGDGHPNAKANSLWAQRIAAGLGQRLSSLMPCADTCATQKRPPPEYAPKRDTRPQQVLR